MQASLPAGETVRRRHGSAVTVFALDQGPDSHICHIWQDKLTQLPTGFTEVGVKIEPNPRFDPLDATDESLIWSLQAFENQMRAVNFVRQFSEILCVYSPKVQQLYGSYEIVVPRRENRQLVVVPDLFAFQDTWYHITTRALERTGLMILPGELVRREGLHLRIPFDNGRRGRVVPLQNGIRAISRSFRDQGRDFLPVITRGDLRALRRKTPLLHLNSLNLKPMADKSRFELNDIRNTIRSRLQPWLSRD